MNLYVYYEVPLADATEAARRVRALQAEMAAQVGRAAFLSRTPAAAHAETWMEIYEGVTPAFEATLAAAAQRHGLDALTGDRHVERFVERGGDDDHRVPASP